VQRRTGNFKEDQMIEILSSGKTRVAAVLATTALAFATTASTASAQPQTGLVNVAVTGNTVQVPIGIAANVCGVNAAVLAHAVGQTGVSCAADAQARAISSAGPRGGPGTRQRGLINLNVSDNVIQVPVSAAVNICGVNAAVLSQFVGQSDVACTATSGSGAEA
jgi:ChpA-C